MGKQSQDNTAEYHQRICRAVDYINAHLAESPTVAEIAAAAPFSSFHFQRLFRALLGETVAEFTRRVRLETAARHLIFRPTEEVTEVAIDLGFSSSQNFAKAFKQHFGVSPTQYRERAGENQLTVSHGNERAAIPSLVNRDGDANLAVSVRDLPATRVAYQRHFGSYNEPGVQTAFDELQRWAEARQLNRNGEYLGIPWDDADVTPLERCRFDACLRIGADVWTGTGVNTQTIPAGRYAVYRCHITANDFDTPWTQLMQIWLPSSGYQPADGPRFERYLSDGNGDPEGRWELEICLPVAPI